MAGRQSDSSADSKHETGEHRARDSRSDTGQHPSAEMTQEIPVVRPEETEVQEAALVLLGHPEPREVGKHWRLKPEQAPTAEIGRLSSCDIAIGHASAVSRRHARIEIRDAGYRLEDLGSTNGTYLNGERIESACWLSSGDRIQIGPVHLKFIVGADVEAAYHEMMYSLAVTDPLTGVANRRRFEEELEREFARAGRHHRRLGLLILDIDEFKQINDHHGHPVADQVLKQVGAGLQRITREEQTVARIGGDEFAILVPEADASGLRRIAERAHAEVTAVEVDGADGKVAPTCSIGGAVVDATEGQASDLYSDADAALYKSKKQGRNRVTIDAR